MTALTEGTLVLAAGETEMMSLSPSSHLVQQVKNLVRWKWGNEHILRMKTEPE